ncbi:hypothetical protein ACQKDB_16615 [Planococcus kocurii]|uniref:hypothetical protein n=1 Tax=Planococcus kocurii TaxID=1374 RepID=UPI003D0546DA
MTVVSFTMFSREELSWLIVRLLPLLDVAEPPEAAGASELKPPAPEPRLVFSVTFREPCVVLPCDSVTTTFSSIVWSLAERLIVVVVCCRPEEPLLFSVRLCAVVEEGAELLVFGLAAALGPEPELPAELSRPYYMK